MIISESVAGTGTQECPGRGSVELTSPAVQEMTEVPAVGVIVPEAAPLPVAEFVTGDAASWAPVHRSTSIDPRRLTLGVLLTVIEPGDPDTTAV
jgi:hypothetical protein